MPLIKYSPEIGLNKIEDELKPANNQTDTLSTLKAAFATENSIGSMIDGYTPETYRKVEGYSPFDDPETLKGYEEFADTFTYAVSPSHTDHLKSQIDKERENKAYLDKAGTLGMVGSMAAGILDPINIASAYVPFGVAVKGASIATTAGKSAVAGGVFTAVQEGALQETQETRTATESITNISMAAGLGGALGGGVQRLVNGPKGSAPITPEAQDRANTNNSFSIANGLLGKFKKQGGDIDLNVAAKAIKDDLEGNAPNKSVGAAGVYRNTLDDESMRETGLNWTAKATITGRLAQSPAIKTRQVAQELLENNFTYKKNLKGIATPQAVETKIKRYDALRYKAIETINQQFAKVKGRIPKVEFQEMIGKAMRRGDKSEIPEVQAAAQEIRKGYEFIKEEMQRFELLPEYVKTIGAKSYLNRAWNFNKIRADRSGLVDILAKWTKRNSDIEFSKNKAKMQKLIDDGIDEDQFITNPKYIKLTAEAVTEQEAIDAANAIVNKIIGAPTGAEAVQLMPEGLVGKAGILKSRTLTIPDEAIEDYLESNIEYVFDSFLRQAAPEIELTKQFGRSDMGDQIAEITETYSELINKAETPKQRAKLEKQRDADIRDIEHARDKLTGRFIAGDPTSFFVRAARTFKTYNYVTMLGGMAISSISDVARPMMQHGLKNYVSAIKSYSGAPKAFKHLAKDELRSMGIALEMALTTRTRVITDLADPYKGNSKVEKAMDLFATGQTYLSGMAKFTDVMKMTTGLMSQDVVLKSAEAVYKNRPLNKNVSRDIARMGLNENDLKLIYKQYKKHGDKSGSLMLGRSDLWDDTYIAERYQTAILGDVENTIITPSVGDSPIVSSGVAGSVILQFKSFVFSANNKLLLAGVQQRDSKAALGMASMVGLGYLTYEIKCMLKGEKPDRTPANVIKQGVDRSGILGLMGEANGTLENLSGGKAGFSAVLGTEVNQRFQSRSALAGLMGPSWSTGENIVTIANGITSGQFDDAQVRAIRKMLPYQNLFYLTPAFNYAEEKAKKAIK